MSDLCIDAPNASDGIAGLPLYIGGIKEQSVQDIFSSVDVPPSGYSPSEHSGSEVEYVQKHMQEEISETL